MGNTSSTLNQTSFWLGSEIMGYIDAGLVAPTFNDAGQAAANLAKLQAALDQGGDVYFIGRGVAYISGPLEIGDNTKLIIDKEMVLTNASGAPGNMLVTKNFAAWVASGDGIFTPVTLSWSSGQDVGVAWTAHGLSDGAPIYIDGADQAIYNGVFQVEVVDADNLTYTPMRQPTTAPTGTTGAVVANRNIIVEGGQFDYNFPTINPGNTPQAFALIGAFAQNIEFRDIIAKNVSKYCVCFGGVRDYYVKNLFAPHTNSDGVKVYGPAFNGVIDGVSGVFGDDVVSFHNLETVAPYTGFNFTGGGDIIGAIGRNLDGLSPTSIAVIYPVGGGVIQDVGYDGIHGFADNTALRIAGGDVQASGLYFKNSDAFGGYVLNVSDVTIDVLTLENIAMNQLAANPGPSLAILSTATIGVLNVDNAAASLPGAPLATSNTYLAISGEVDNVNLNNACFDNPSQNFLAVVALTSGAQARQINVNDGKFLSPFYMVQVQGGSTGSPMVHINGAYINVAGVVNAFEDCSLSIENCNILVAYNGILRTEGTSKAYELSMTSNRIGGTAPTWVEVGTTNSVTPFGFDVPIDIALVPRTAGAYCKATVNQGTIIAGNLVVCDATGAAGSWHQVTNPALVY
jgi:hypothetical protein